MFQTSIPLTYWGECVPAATYLINRTPTSNLEDRSPFEVLFSSPPDYSQIKVFGCLCHASTIPIHRHKFSPRENPCVFMGYPQGYKGYKLYDLQHQKFIISRDVVFHESIFPFTKSTSHTLPHKESEPVSLPITSSIPGNFDYPNATPPTTQTPDNITPTQLTTACPAPPIDTSSDTEPILPTSADTTSPPTPEDSLDTVISLASTTTLEPT